MDANDLFTTALGLRSPWHVDRITFDESKGEVDIALDFTRGSRFECPVCTQSDCMAHDTVEKRWRHLNFFQHKAFLSARVPRIKCPKCGVKMVDVPWGRKESGFTLLFEAYVMKLVAHMPIAAVARLVGETDQRLWRILKFYIQGGVDRIDCSEVEEVGVDETSAKRNHDYISLFYDMRGRRLLFATDGKDADTFEEFGEFMWEHGGNILNVRELSCDMSPAFIKGARDSMDNAHVTFDRFHISKLLNEAVDKVRKSEAKNDKTIKGSMYLWLHNPENLTPSQGAKLEELKLRYGTLAEAYRFKQSFRDFYEQPDLRSARGFLKAWVTEALNSGIAPIVKAANTIRRHWHGIIRWHVSRINNGVLEALASLVQAAKRKARGYRNKDTLKMIAYLIAGKLDLRLPT